MYSYNYKNKNRNISQEYKIMAKSTFQAQDVKTFEDVIQAQHEKNWEAYKRQSSGNVQYTRAHKVAHSNGFKLGLFAIVPVIIACVVMF